MRVREDSQLDASYQAAPEERTQKCSVVRGRYPYSKVVSDRQVVYADDPGPECSGGATGYAPRVPGARSGGYVFNMTCGALQAFKDELQEITRRGVANRNRCRPRDRRKRMSRSSFILFGVLVLARNITLRRTRVMARRRAL